MDRITSLTVFVQVAESGGFSAAARRLKMSTTMVSKHIQALEERLGARLLNRTTRKVGLTEVGREYYQRCAQILNDLEHANEIASASQSTPRGVLRIYTATHLVRSIAPVVTEYLALYPHASVDVTMGEREIDLLDEGFDLAIRLTSPADSSLIVRNLVTWRHVLCASPAYLAEKGYPQQLSDLESRNCLRHALYPYQNEWRFTDRNGAPAFARVAGNLVSNSGETLRIAAVHGRGILLGAGFMVADDVREGRLVRILPHLNPVEFTMNAVYPHRHHVSAKIRCFIDLLVSHNADHHRLLNPVA